MLSDFPLVELNPPVLLGFAQKAAPQGDFTVQIKQSGPKDPGVFCQSNSDKKAEKNRLQSDSPAETFHSETKSAFEFEENHQFFHAQVFEDENPCLLDQFPQKNHQVPGFFYLLVFRSSANTSTK